MGSVRRLITSLLGRCSRSPFSTALTDQTREVYVGWRRLIKAEVRHRQVQDTILSIEPKRLVLGNFCDMGSRYVLSASLCYSLNPSRTSMVLFDWIHSIDTVAHDPPDRYSPHQAVVLGYFRQEFPLFRRVSLTPLLLGEPRTFNMNTQGPLGSFSSVCGNWRAVTFASEQDIQ